MWLQYKGFNEYYGAQRSYKMFIKSKIHYSFGSTNVSGLA